MQTGTAALRPRVEEIEPILLAGVNATMSLADFHPEKLWKLLVPTVAALPNNGRKLLSVSMYPPGYFDHYQPGMPFEKWAAFEVSAFENTPEALQRFEIPAGLYAVFHHRGPADDKTIFRRIFSEWLPTSGYAIDNRPHFEMIKPSYNHENNLSDEDIYIPVKSKIV